MERTKKSPAAPAVISAKRVNEIVNATALLTDLKSLKEYSVKQPEFANLMTSKFKKVDDLFEAMMMELNKQVKAGVSEEPKVKPEKGEKPVEKPKAKPDVKNIIKEVNDKVKTKSSQKEKKEKAPKAPKEPAGPSAYGTAVEIMCKKPTLTFQELKKLLAKKGFEKDSAARTAQLTVKKVYELLSANGFIIKK